MSMSISISMRNKSSRCYCLVRGDLLFPTQTMDDKHTISNESVTALMSYKSNACLGHGEPSRVWAPPVCLLLVELDSDTGKETTNHIDARMCLYSRGNFSFLLYMSRSPTSNADQEEWSSYQKVFRDVAEQLTAALDLIAPVPSGDEIEAGDIIKSDGHDEVKHVTTKRWEVPGQDVIAIDRGDQTLTLFADPQLYEGQTKREHDGPTKRVFKAKTSTASPPRVFQSPVSDNSSTQQLVLELDCRYRIASQLSPDSLLAFDDAMDDVQQAKRAGGHTKPYEMCTLLSNRWVYAFAKGDRELYALFDSAFFVTVADVQNAALEIRTELLGISTEK